MIEQNGEGCEADENNMQERLVVDNGLRWVMLVVGVRRGVRLLGLIHLVVDHLLRHVHVRGVAVLLRVVILLMVRRIRCGCLHRWRLWLRRQHFSSDVSSIRYFTGRELLWDECGRIYRSRRERDGCRKVAPWV